MREHAFLLGNRGGFVLYLPATRGTSDRMAQPIKWFGASGFGRSFFEAVVVWVEVDGALVSLNRKNQTEFIMRLDGATRVYQVGDHEIRESFLVPDGLQAFVVTLETELPCVLKPEFEMRYYQTFDTDFSQYRAEETAGDLLVSNRVTSVGPLETDLQFHGMVGTDSGSGTIEMLPEHERLVEKTYLKDELREKLIINVYKETMNQSPDHAPIWDAYSTKVYAPARFQVQGPVSLLCAFGDEREEAAEGCARFRANLPSLRQQKRDGIHRQLEDGLLETGNHDIDTAYAQVLTRFNDALVARDACMHVEPIHNDHYDAIFAGDKYFMDAWKRDENISLGALLVTNEYESVRRILDNSWQFQDQRTGRLPQIIRACEPLVYYSSDGTLWALHRLFEYTQVSGDESLLEEKMPMVEHFFRACMGFVQGGLAPSGSIVEEEHFWETWADTPFTPRAGYPVEIELLWLTVLQEFLSAVRRHNEESAEWMARLLEQGRQTFQQFVREGYLADSLSYDWKPDEILTPSGYIAFGLDYPLPVDLQRSMVVLARDQLAGHRGVRSLAPRDWAKTFPDEFLQDRRNCRGKDMASVGIYNYHRGIEWEWFNPYFLQGELTCGDPEQGYRRYVQGQVIEAIGEVGIGGLRELHDMRGQVGADFQAWSMAGFLQSLHLLAGIQVDALARTVRICPALPSALPYLRCRRRVGNTRFDLRYEQPSPTSHELQVRLLDPVSEDHTLYVGFRVPRGSMIRSATCNGSQMSADSWSYTKGCHPGAHGTLWTTRALEPEIRITLDV
ncbi:MAG: hypothetical protein DLM70_14900 [Chloroflexi bacterium]|nr:MAG: hypothetical protein DLM70_14900 [Chloroflexota bacterium]